MPKTRIPMTISIIISFVDGVDDFGLGVIGGAVGVVLGDNSIDGVGNGVSVGAGVDVGASVGEGVMVGVLVGKKKRGWFWRTSWEKEREFEIPNICIYIAS